MPIGGENVGTAYVRILADGGDLDNSIRDQMDDIDWDRMGRKSSSEWSDGFADEQKKAPNQTKLRDAIAGPLIRGNWLTEKFFREKNWSNFRAAMDKEFGAAGRLAADSLEEDLLNGLDFDGLDKRLDNIIPLVAKKQKELNATMARAHDDALRLNEEYNRQVNADNDKAYDVRNKALEKMFDDAYQMNVEFNQRTRKTLDEAYRMNADFDKRVLEDEIQLRRDRDKQMDLYLASVQAHYDDAYRMNTDFDKRRRTLLEDAYRMNADFNRRQRDDDLQTSRDQDKQWEIHIANLRRLEEGHRDMHGPLARSVKLTDKWSDSIGRTFGKGSRNDFLNIVGRMIGGMVSLIGVIPRAILAVKRFGTAIGEAFAKDGTTGAIKFLFSSLGQGVAGLIGIGALGVVVAASIGIMSSALLSLAGAAVAMASSLAFAAGGGIAVFVGALVPLAAGVGVATLAIMNMDKETKKAFDGIGKSFKALGRDASKNIFNSAAKDAGVLNEAVKDLGSITGPVSKALGGLLDEFIASISDPAVSHFEEFLGRTLPSMVTSLGHIVGNFGEIFMGIWIAITPFVQRFLNYLGQITQDFADWTNSAEGKNSIRDFMERAFESAKKVGGTLKEVVGLIGDLFGVSNETGNDLFQSLTDTIQGWRDKLAEAKQDGTLQKWFEDAKHVATAIGEMIPALARFIEKMDTPANREMVMRIANAFVTVSDFIGDAMTAFQLFGAVMRGIYNRLIGPVFAFILDSIGNILEGIANMLHALGDVPGFGWAERAADQIDGAAESAHNLADSIREIPDSHNTVITAATNPATLAKVEAQLNGVARARTATVTVMVRNTQGGTAPGGGVGGADGDPSTPQRAVTTITTPTDPNTGKPTTGQGGNSKTVNANGWTIVTPSQDPEAVAAETFNRLAAAGY